MQVSEFLMAKLFRQFMNQPLNEDHILHATAIKNGMYGCGIRHLFQMINKWSG